MALDNRSKRASSVRVLKPWQADGPLGDGTISQGDRQHASWMYSGISAQTVSQAATGSGFWLLRARRRMGEDD